MKRQGLDSTDFRKVSELVHERRAERSRNSETLREDPEAARAAVRTYRPEERLRCVDDEAQQLVQDACDIPRTWDPEVPQSLLYGQRTGTAGQIRTCYASLLVASLVLTALTLGAFYGYVLGDALALVSITLVSVAVVIIATASYLPRLGAFAWFGLAILLAESAAVFTVLQQL